MMTYLEQHQPAWVCEVMDLATRHHIYLDELTGLWMWTMRDHDDGYPLTADEVEALGLPDTRHA